MRIKLAVEVKPLKVHKTLKGPNYLLQKKIHLQFFEAVCFNFSSALYLLFIQKVF